MDESINGWGSQHSDCSPHAGTSRPLHSTADSLFLGPLPLTTWPQLLLPVVSSSLQLQGAQMLIRHVF